MEVCVNLTRSSNGTLNETVRVNVFNNESSVYIPDRVAIASMLKLHVFDGITCRLDYNICSSPRCF